MKNQMCYWILISFLIFNSCDKSSNTTNPNSKTSLFDSWNLEEIEIISPPNGSSTISWKNIFSMMGSTNVLGNGACKLEILSLNGSNVWKISGAQIYNSAIITVCCPKYIGPIYKYNGEFTFNSKEIFFTYYDDYKDRYFYSEKSYYQIVNGKLEILLHLKDNETWKFLFI